MTAVDNAADETIDVLIDRAGRAVARTAVRMLGGAYGRRVLVFAGKGNNGNDGRIAAAHLERLGVRCEVRGPHERRTHEPDLVLDGCVGTGLNRPFVAPPTGEALVLAIDIPSGINGRTGEMMGSAVRADATLTFAARKPGLLLGDGPDHAGEIEVADIGLDLGSADAWLMVDADALAWPQRAGADHKWRRAVWVVGGQPGMTGALALASEAAARAGAGYVAVSTPGGWAEGHREAVSIELPASSWADEIAERAHRFGALVIGPGMAPSLEADQLASVVAIGVPTVLDAGAIDLVARQPSMVAGHPVVLTPHDGEFERLLGVRPGRDRMAATRAAAAELGAVVLLKGPTTVIADPAGQVRLVNAGDASLATAGTGDVLAGMIGAGLAGGLPPLEAAALAAHLHGRAGARTGSTFPIASDLLGLLEPTHS